MRTSTTGMAITERLVAALTVAWSAIQARHPDVPDVVLTLGSGTLGARRGQITWGHFAAGRWHTADPGGQHEQDDEHEAGDGAAAAPEPVPEPASGPAAGLAELFVGGEGLRRGARAVLGTLLHEAAHGVASTRGIKDTSRQGRYHNRRFSQLAAELGVTVALDGTRGWSATTLPDQTAAVYGAELAQLAEAITAYRRAEPTGAGGTTTRTTPPATCACVPARRIRVARSVLAAGSIVCGVCKSEFTTDEPDDAPAGIEPDDDEDGDATAGGEDGGGEDGGAGERP